MSFSVTIELVVGSIDLQTGTQHVLKTSSDLLPFLEINDEFDANILTKVEELCKEYVDLDFEWLQPQLIDVRNDYREIVITYGTLIPLDTPLKRGQFVPITTLNNNLVTEVFHRYESLQ